VKSPLQLIKLEINQSFLSNEWQKGFTLLLSLSKFDIINILKKREWLKNPDIRNYFFHEFCHSQHPLVFNNDASEYFLIEYLSTLNETTRELDLILLCHYQKNFANAIKQSKAFLNKKYLAHLKAYTFFKPYEEEKEIWIALEKQFTLYHEKIEHSWNGVKHLKKEEILMGILIFIDISFYEKFEVEHHENLNDIFNYAITFLFNKKPEDPIYDETEFNNLFVTMFIQDVNQSVLRSISSFFNAIYQWNIFETFILNSYCYSANCKLKFDNNVFSVESNNKDIKPIHRYSLLEKRFGFLANLFVLEYEQKGLLKLPKGSPKNQQLNKDLHTQTLRMNLMCDYLHIHYLIINNKKMNIEKISEGLIGFSFNRKVRYLEEMYKFTNQNKISWLKSVIDIHNEADQKGITNIPFPFLYILKSDLIESYKMYLSEFEREDIKEILALFSNHIIPKQNSFPLELKFNYAITPFLSWGDYYVVQTSLFANKSWFYSLAQLALKSYSKPINSSERNASSFEMENHLADTFKKQKWNAHVFTQTEATIIDGDIDIMIDDGRTQLFIQMKRTQFHLNSKEIYKNTLENDLKGVSQLVQGCKSIQMGLIPGLKLFKDHHKWLVINSYSKVLEQSEGVVFINYFDLRWALENKKFSTLNDLIAFVLNDEPHKMLNALLEKQEAHFHF
jgi:hypothetical protein